ncbi:MAG: porin [Vicinamibacterales bacterium]
MKLSAAALRTAAGALAASPTPAAAQAPAAGADPILTFFQNTELSGFVDGYYLYNFNKGAGGNALRAFDVTHNSFSLNLIELAIERKPMSESRGGYRIDFDYGPTAGFVNFVNATEIEHIQQAYVSYLAPVGSGLQLDFGRFVTPHGAEVIETKDNMNYSRSLLFTWAIPFAHTGLRASYSVNDMVTIGGFLVNGWDVNTDNNTGKTVGGMVTLKPFDALSVIAGYMGGPEQTGNNSDWRHLLDTTLSYTLNPKITLVGNYDYGHESFGAAGDAKWQGVAGYVKYQANDWFALSPRFEIFSDTDGVRTGTAQDAKGVTVTADVKHKDGVRLFIEYRRDFSNVDFFVDDAGAPVNHQDTVTFGMVYAFSSKTP